ncbi:MAG: malonyl CoA-acyl carrier protein transacylase [Alteromonadaceae bacterium]|jgi:malonyl CoA-acyl carrier protein transacylase
MKTFVFPGQGSQAKGMGGELFDEFATLTKQADDILGYSIKQLCLDDSDDVLGQTEFTQPALYIVNALSYYQQVKTTGVIADFVAGHSLGEYNALLASGVFSFETGLRLVKKRGELMSRATGGAMAAIVNSNEQEIVSILKDNGLTGVEIANYNTPTQIVVSGLKEQVDKAAEFFKVGRIRFLPLKTSGAFHSSLMQFASDEFATFVEQFSFGPPAIPVISNISAREYEDTEISAGLIKQITHSVRWTESIEYLLAKGEMSFVEIGNGIVLTKLIKGIEKAAAKKRT